LLPSGCRSVIATANGSARQAAEDRDDRPAVRPSVDLREVVVALGIAAVDREVAHRVARFDDVAERRERVARQGLGDGRTGRLGRGVHRFTLPHRRNRDTRVDVVGLIVPYTLDTNDRRFALPQGFSHGDEFFEYLRDAFAVMYAEGDERPAMMSVGMHCRLLGRPGRFRALQRFLDHVEQHDRVWVCRRVDVARHWREHHPYQR